MTAKRTLVDIYPEKAQQLEKLKERARKSGKRPPSIPQLVDEAITVALPQLEKKYAA